MNNVFEIFKAVYIKELVSAGKIYLVSQTYDPGIVNIYTKEKTGILFTGYEDRGLAQIHMNAVKGDPFGAIIDLKKSEHEVRLRKMLTADSKYAVFWAVVRSVADLRKRFDLHYAKHIQRWISKNTSWHIGRDEKITPKLQVIFGELFVVLRRGPEERRITMKELAKT